MSSTNFRSILIFTSCVVGTYNILLVWVGFYWEGSYFLSTIMVSVGIYTLDYLPTDGQMLGGWVSFLRHCLRHFPEGNLVYYMGEFLLGGVLFFVHYNGKCWY